MQVVKIPRNKISEEDFQSIGMEVAELLVRAGLVKSKTEARKSIENGGIRVNDIKVVDKFARMCFNSTNDQWFLVERI